MAEFKSQYQTLGFYVDGEFKKFIGGRYVTDDEATIEVLTQITDATRVDEPAEETPKPTKPKAPAKKASGK
ncbi:hypothetical protein [Peribacillus huizhouensis]|uniref:XkdX family protein n=1 Tax=Peribacillus huizhouensis TaxID=1501239 RepID=A0ABR6CS89_9BACI|nr:hypothetical protein [Peribacillus huizhouensis]MBA9027523.1 hypothetical protein [Peribacillus huizhouensis]